MMSMLGDNMSRLQRNLLEDCCCHITHRCHNRSYHFRFKSERNDYRSLLIEMSRRYKVSVFDYIITSNHIHLIVNSGKIKNISDGMRFLQGATAQRYNRKTKREGAFWRDRYHITLIQNGVHLRRCIFYIDFNMVRTGKISHPSEWRWSGYDELSGNRKRYRVIDFENLLQCTGVDSAESFINWYNNTIEDEINSYRRRQEFWSNSLAVGTEEWINGLASSFCQHHRKLYKKSFDRKIVAEDDNTAYVLETSKRNAGFFTRNL